MTKLNPIFKVPFGPSLNPIFKVPILATLRLTALKKRRSLYNVRDACHQCPKQERECCDPLQVGMVVVIGDGIRVTDPRMGYLV
jgi:hypothetical protein